jgi:hypothetical protein
MGPVMESHSEMQHCDSDGQHVTYCDPKLGIYLSKLEFLFNYLENFLFIFII